MYVCVCTCERESLCVSVVSGEGPTKSKDSHDQELSTAAHTHCQLHSAGRRPEHISVDQLPAKVLLNILLCVCVCVCVCV